MRRQLLFAGIVVLATISAGYSAAPTGWTCYAAGDDVFIASVGGNPQKIADNVGAKHACWSYDGSTVFFIQNSGDIYAMNNDGSDRRKIGNADNKSYSAIAAYRPEPKSVLCVDGNAFYKINATTKDKSKVCDAGKSIAGEIAISRSGDRIAFRGGDSNLYKLRVGRSPSKYAGYCSASLSPNGNYLTENQKGHTTLEIHNWSGGVSTVNAGVIGKWDNQAFAVNSDEWICAVDDDSGPTNQGKGVGIVSRSNTTHMVTSWSGSTTMYPRFFVGDLPGVSAPQTYSLTVDNGGGDGSYEAGTTVNISADNAPSGKLFDQWTGDVDAVADVGDPTTSVTMPSSAVTVTATYKDAPATEFTLTVTNGTGGGSYLAGTVVDVASDTPPAGKVFDSWSGDVAAISDAGAAQTTVTMPESNVSITATFKDEPVQADKTRITSPENGAVLREGTEITLTAEGSGLQWSYDANSDGLNAVAIGSGNTISFTVPTGVTGPKTITIFCTGDNGSDQVDCTIGGATGITTPARNGAGERQARAFSIRLHRSHSAIPEVGYDIAGRRLRQSIPRVFIEAPGNGSGDKRGGKRRAE
jgi:hypothetical protein